MSTEAIAGRAHPGLFVGYAEYDITPDAELPLIGYEQRQGYYPSGHDGLRDRLLARAMVLREDQTVAVLISLDLATLDTPTADALRRVAGDAAGVDPLMVMVSCTHTHSGPFPIFDPDQTADALAEDAVCGDEHRWSVAGRSYYQMLADRLHRAVSAAGAAMYPVTVGGQSAPLGLGYVRRVPTADGLRHCWNPQEQPDLPLSPSPDPTCSVLVLQQVNGPRRWVLFSLGVHGVVLGKSSNVVSADWPGAACRYIEQLLPGSRAMMFQGASGEVHPWLATQEQASAVELIGQAAGAFVASVSLAARPGDGCGSLMRLACADLQIGSQALHCCAWRLGPMVLVGAPVELFASVSAQLRARVPVPLMILTETNGRTGYWPGVDDFALGKYEVEVARHYDRKPEHIGQLLDGLVQLIGQVQ